MNDPALALLIKDVEEKIRIVRREAMYDYIAPGGRTADARFSVTLRGDDLANSVEALLMHLVSAEISENFTLSDIDLRAMRFQVHIGILHGDICKIYESYKNGNHKFVRHFMEAEFYGSCGQYDKWKSVIAYDQKFGKYPDIVMDRIFKSLAKGR